ncbi:hypothetical protein Rsub_06499 [Raphidocelis subcapitata]|uniref:Lactation elevated 1 n=1 Tax=Raphidocelis subcapitata TaxID=307507 RepID=A0A2V0P3R8_9CHLO|nr:hypothetical protein Rsub_06499 [Raphidocelis subcapitata]|eukprot:GBF94229.1 hypothetical protein Rsub_06499 [Raphidocelis subcapitata]
MALHTSARLLAGALHPRGWSHRLAPAGAAAASTAAAPAAATPATSATSAAGDGGWGGDQNPLLARYSSLLARGELLPDEPQAAVVARLAALLGQLRGYSEAMGHYREELEQYKARRRERLQQLEAEDAAAESEAAARAAEAARRAEQEQQQAGPAAALASWLARAAGGLGRGGGADAAASRAAAATPAQRANVAAAARRARVARELGAGPRAPPAPKGVYIHGSVGSGKSIIMDLFFAEAAGADGGGGGGGGGVGLQFARRLHFNAAMLELHGRLHLLDQRREAREHGVPMGGVTGGVTGGGGGAFESAAAGAGAAAAAAAAAAARRVPAAVLDAALDLGEELEGAAGGGPSAAGAAGGEGGGAAAAEEEGDGPVSRWFDSESRRQKEAKAAVLAVRRHLRETRAGRVPRERLAAANAAVMRTAARSLIRSAGPDPHSGWDHGRGHAAALLCFDEVTDVWSAVALKALFEALTSEGCVVVATSNRAPHELPRHGLHEAMWEHFLASLLAGCDALRLSAAEDYRRRNLGGAAAAALRRPLGVGVGGGGSAAAAEVKAAGAAAAAAEGVAAAAAGAEPQRLYFWPLGSESEREMESLWRQVAGSSTGSGGGGGGGGGGDAVPVLFGRLLEVPRAAGGAAWFDFSDLCGRPLGAADYLALAHRYHTVFVTGVPALSLQTRDRARRFITLVDELYNARTLLVLSADAAPDALFSGAGAGEEALIDWEGLQFETAVEGARLRRDLMAEGGVAPVASSAPAAAAAADALGGAEERFAFARAVSRLYEMQGPLYARARPRGGAGWDAAGAGAGQGLQQA